MSKRVYIVGERRGGSYGGMFVGKGWSVVDDLEDADLVQFTGGSDVSPWLYGEANHPTTGNDPNRDEYEESIFKLAVALGIPCAGICRGGQFLNVMNGGKMYQNVDGHANGPHLATGVAPIGTIMVTSTHHQMIRPTKDAIILMTARQAFRREHMNGDKIEVHTTPEDDIESVYYPATNTLCYQPHPEFMSGSGDCRDAYFFFINNYLMDDEGQGNVGSGPRDLIGQDCECEEELACAV